MKPTLLINLIYAVALPALAQSQLPSLPNNYTIMGVGNKPCWWWTRDRRQDSKSADQDIQWLEGYITAYNAMKGGDITINSDANRLLSSMDDLCKDNPSSTISHSAAVFVAYLLYIAK